jgi:hypothetical protein
MGQCVTATLQVDPGVLLLACPVDVSKPLSMGEGRLCHSQASCAGLIHAHPPQPDGDGFTPARGHSGLLALILAG